MAPLDYRVPQADDVAKILDLALWIEGGSAPDPAAIAAKAGIVERQAQYYLQALEILGMVVPGSAPPKLTDDGLEFAASPEEERVDVVVGLMARVPVMTALGRRFEDQAGRSLGKEDFVAFLEDYTKQHNIPLSGATIPRRALTLARWFAWFVAHGGMLVMPLDRKVAHRAMSDPDPRPRTYPATDGSTTDQTSHGAPDEEVAASIIEAPMTRSPPPIVAKRPELGAHVSLPSLFVGLAKDSKLSVIARGDLPPIMKALYVRDTVDDQIDDWLAREDGPRLLVLTGSAGHGKSAAISQAMRAAEERGIEIRVRPDATHADHPHETYKEGLRRFLAPYADGAAEDPPRGIIAINLGLALNFFSTDKEDAARWGRIAAAFDQRFGLGMGFEGQPSTQVRFIDLSRRLSIDRSSNGSADLPFLRKLIQRLDAKDGESIVAKTIAAECASCSVRTRCAVLSNALLLSEQTVRENLVHAMLSASVKHEVHLTPRLVLDALSGLVVPVEWRELAQDEELGVCPIKDEGVLEGEMRETDGSKWGERLRRTIFANAFPLGRSGYGTDSPLIANMPSEDPATERSASQDGLVLEWGSDPQKLSRGLPGHFVDAVGLRDVRTLGVRGLADLIRARTWLADRPHERIQCRPFDQFIALCLGDAEATKAWEDKLIQAIEKIALASFHDRPRGAAASQIGIRMNGLSSRYHLMAPLSPIHGQIAGAPGSLSVNHAHFRLVVRSGQGDPIEFRVDWKAFEFLVDVSEGYTPRTTNRFHATFVSNVVRRLAMASSMDSQLEVRDRDQGARLSLKGKTLANDRIQIRAEVKP